MRRGYGLYGRSVEVFEMWEAANRDPRALQAMGFLAEGELMEGTGAPEGRADFPFFLQTVIRHVMRERFRTVASQWQQYAGVESAKDFREHSVSQVNGIVGIAPVREQGEYPRMRSAETPGPSFAVSKHGGLYSLTFELLINDETDYMLNRAPAEIGRTSAEYMAQTIIAFIESNPTYAPDGLPFFGSGHGNEFTGSAADPTEDNLITMLESMTLRRDPATNTPFMIQPEKIVVRGTRQKYRFMQMIRSSQTTERTAAAVGPTSFARGNDNPLSYDGGILPADAVTNDPWLNDVDDYYILGNIADRPAFIMSFLRGRQEPFIGIKDPGVRDAMGAGTDPYEWDLDTIDFKVRTIFGTSLGEPLAAIRARPT